jgi:hypothetical protein
MKKTILYDSAGKRFFLVPADMELTTGELSVATMDDAVRSVSETEILPYETVEDVAMAYLRTDYDRLLEDTKQALQRINRFAVLTGRMSTDFIQQMAQQEFAKLTPEEQQPFTIGKETIEEVLASIQQPGATPEQQMESFRKSFAKVPDILKYFDENNLALAAKDPEAWAKMLNEKMFGEQDAANKKANSERLKRDVQESIARGLRSAGMEPIDPDAKDT